MQERSHAFAMKSQMWLLDPRPNLESIVTWSSAGSSFPRRRNTPVMLELRIRACHVYGRFRAEDNRRPAFGVGDALDHPVRDASRIVLPPANFEHEQEKIRERWPAAVDFVRDRRLNEFLGGAQGDIGIIVQGGLYNTLLRALELLGLADAVGNTPLPLYVLNVTYPLIEEEIIDFCAGKGAVLIVEEGQPEYIEQHLNMVLRHAGSDTRVLGKAVLPRAGEYTGQVLERGVRAFLERHAPRCSAQVRIATAARSSRGAFEGGAGARRPIARTAGGVLHGLSRAAHFHGDEAAATRARSDAHQLRHRLPSVLDPAALQSRQHDHGLRFGRGRRVGLRLGAAASAPSR